MGRVGELLLISGQLSLVAIGGAQTILPELQRQVVSVRGWMGAAEFGALFAIGQAAPGPNVLVFTLVGWRTAGLAGALAATVGVLGPSSVLAWVMEGAWTRLRDRPWRATVQAGLVPVTVGLVLAAGILLAVGTTTEVVAGVITAAVAVAVMTTRVHPLWLLLAGAVVGVLGVR